MGLLRDVRAMNDVQKIKKGGTAKLSISQITCLITNMPDAHKNLSSEEFNKVYELYKQMRKCNTKLLLDVNGYLDTAEKIIREFDKIAPYEKYSGGNEIEFSFLMEDIREAPNEENSPSAQRCAEIIFDDEDRKYIKYIVEQAHGQVTIDDAQSIMKVLYCFHENGKTEALKKFDMLANKIIKENPPVNALTKISFLSGLLYPNGVLSKEESDNLSKKYSNPLMDLLCNSFKTD